MIILVIRTGKLALLCSGDTNPKQILENSMKDTPTSTTLEFSMDLTCSSCEKKVANVLDAGGVIIYKNDLDRQSVVVVTDKTSETVESGVETTGKLGVLVGSGNMGAAVVMLGREGD